MTTEARGPATLVRPVGADVVIETLKQLGVDIVFGVPGVHALPYWEAMRVRDVTYAGARTELCAAFAADGYVRASGRPAALALSTGPGTLIALAGLLESALSYVPVIALASQVDTELLGQRRGALHELPEQLASVGPVVKQARGVRDVGSIQAAVADAWEVATQIPPGPTFVEIPTDVLNAPATLTAQSGSGRPTGERVGRTVRGDLEEVVELLRASERPLVLAGGGVIRGGAWEEVRAVAEALDAPVLTTFMGKGSLPDDHPLLAGCACDEPPYQAAIREADVVLCAGSELGEEVSSGYELEFGGQLVQIDASGERIGTTYPAISLLGDVGHVLGEIGTRVGPRSPSRNGSRRAAEIRDEIEASLASQRRTTERDLLRAIRSTLPENAITSWDMTILGYWAARDFPAGGPRRFLYPVGSGTLGYAWPAAIGASLAEPDTPILAVVGDGGVMYALQELASARQLGSPATLLIVDDGGYGILAEYQRRTYGATHGVELARTDFDRLAESFGVSARETSESTLAADLATAIDHRGPSVLWLRTSLEPPTTMK